MLDYSALHRQYGQRKETGAVQATAPVAQSGPIDYDALHRKYGQRTETQTQRSLGLQPLMAQKALESPSLPLAVKRSLEPKAAPASKSSNGVGGKAASSYLTGGTSTPATPYGAGLQAGIAKTPERKETPKAVPLPSEPAPQKLDKGPRLRKEIALDWAKRIEQQPMLSGGLVAPEENKAFIRQLNKELEADDMLAMGLDPRWAALTRKQGLLTDEEKDEASAAALQLATQPLQVRYQEAHQEAGASPYGQIPAMLRFERSMTPEEKKLFKAQTALRSAAADRSGVSAPSAAAMGLVSSLPGATWADREGAKAQREMTPKPFRSPLTPEGWSPYAQARAEHPIAYGGGAVAGNVGMALLGGQVANAAVRTAPVLRNLPKAAQAVISTGLNFGTRGALQTAENGGDAGEIIQSGVTNALTGMAGQGVGQVVNLGAAKLLDHLGLKNSIPANVAASGAEGVAFAGTQMGTRMLLDEDYRPTAGEAVQDLTTAAAFSAISRLIQTHAQSKAAAARLQTDVDDMRRDFARIVGNEPINGMGATLDDLAVKVARTRAAINTNIYMGQQDTVNAINEFLDTLDDAIAMKRMELGTVPGTAVDVSAAVGGGSSAPGTGLMVQSGMGTMLPGQSGTMAPVAVLPETQITEGTKSAPKEGAASSDADMVAQDVVDRYVDHSISKSRFVDNPLITDESVADLSLGKVSDALTSKVKTRGRFFCLGDFSEK